MLGWSRIDRRTGGMTRARRSRGATTTEFVILMPIFFVILFGIIEGALVFRTKTTLNAATFDAARYGAMNHALEAPMREELARGMIPLYMNGDTGAGQYARAWSVTQGLAALSGVFAMSTVRIVSPTRSTWNAFGERRRLDIPELSGDTTYRVIPNDNLLYRPDVNENVVINGDTREINIRDANLLKINTFWCHELIVPVVGQLIREIVTDDLMNMNGEQSACEALSQARGEDYIAVTSQATVRMQSDVVGNDLP